MMQRLLFVTGLLICMIPFSFSQNHSTKIYNEYQGSLRAIKNLEKESKTAIGDIASDIPDSEPCGHRYYNPQAFDPVTQKVFEARLKELIEKYKIESKSRGKQVLQIPVVVHVIHQGQAVGDGENISAEQVQSQIRALNDAFARTAGTRYSNTDNIAGLNYNQLTGNAEMEFVLASVDPDGNPTAGINRVETIEGYHLIGGYIDNIIKPATIWNPDYYLNLWSVRLTEGARPGLLGYAVFPSMSGLEGLDFSEPNPNSDGIVCDYRTVGSNAYEQQFDLNSAYQYGVTCIHEVLPKSCFAAFIS